MLVAARAGCDQAKSELLKQFESYLLLVTDYQLDERLRGKLGVSDIVQQTYEKAVIGLDNFEGDCEEQLRAWLRSIAMNQVKLNRRHYKTSKRNISDEQPLVTKNQSTMSYSPVVDRNDTPGTKAIKDEQADAVRLALKNLSEQDQQVIRLRNWEQLEFSEIAQKMEKSESAIRKMWQRAILKLEKEYRNTNL